MNILTVYMALVCLGKLPQYLLLPTPPLLPVTCYATVTSAARNTNQLQNIRGNKPLVLDEHSVTNTWLSRVVTRRKLYQLIHPLVECLVTTHENLTKSQRKKNMYQPFCIPCLQYSTPPNPYRTIIVPKNIRGSKYLNWTGTQRNATTRDPKTDETKHKEKLVGLRVKCKARGRPRFLLASFGHCQEGRQQSADQHNCKKKRSSEKNKC